MNTLFIVLFAVLVAAYLYFSISGRILAIKDRKTDEDRFKEQMEWETQIKYLTNRIGEIQTENVRLAGDVRNWVNRYNDIVFKYNKLDADYTALKNKIAAPDDIPKANDEKHVEDYTEAE